MSEQEFVCIKSESFSGGAKELDSVIREMHSVETTEATTVERKFKKEWAMELHRRVLGGHALPFNWGVAELPQDGRIRRMRVNGQHSSWALMKLLEEDQLPNNIVIRIDTYKVRTEADVVMLFRQFDARESARSREAIAHAYQGFQPDLSGCNPNLVKAAAVGVVWYRKNVLKDVVPIGDDVFQVVNESQLHPFFLMVNGILGNGKSPELMTAPVMGAWFGSWLLNPGRAGEFWRGAAIGDLSEKQDASIDLDVELRRIGKEHEKVKPNDRYAKCVRAWHAFADGTRVTTKGFDISSKKKGVPILGREVTGKLFD